MSDAAPAKPKARDVNEMVRYTMWSVVAVSTPLGDGDRSLLVKEIEAFADDLADADVVICAWYYDAG